jgi:predicted RNA-binding Zn-ribbon protein involved in translation (DUF1610 family)
MREMELSTPQPSGSATDASLGAAKHLCPYCKSTEIARSHRRGPLEKYLLNLIGVRVYRCDDCARRFYAFAHSHPAPAGQQKVA